ncbi:hypothetical protein N7523_005597 [Penicillium sp. IBT 18751x]|nr:hypothetical protein N7523_005597 [Penicillium sp. IBT 18751x]
MISIQTSEQKTWKNDENRNIVPEPQAGALAAGGAAASAEAVEEKEEYELAWELDGDLSRGPGTLCFRPHSECRLLAIP